MLRLERDPELVMYCEVCGAEIPRYVSPNGYAESDYKYALRRACDQPRCRNEVARLVSCGKKDPRPEEIAAAAAEVRRGWTPAMERSRRIGRTEPPPVELPELPERWFWDRRVL